MTNPLQGSDEETQQKQTTRDLLMTVRRALPFSSARPKTHAAYEAIDELLDRAQKEAEARDSLESALREATGILDDLEKLTGFTASALHDELITMQAEIETGREDTARLDWIQAERSAGHSVAFSHSLVALMEAAQRTTEWDRNGNIREAIDAAKASR